MGARGPVGLLVNPTAGRGAGAAAGARTLAALRRLGHRVVDLTATDLHRAGRRAREAAGDLQALVVVGGDGLVHAGVEATAGTTTPLGIVPAGTGNDIARGLGLARHEPAAAVAVLAAALDAGRSRRLDAVQVDGADGRGWYASVLSCGVDALATERANRWRWPKGPSRYTLATARELAVLRPVQLSVALDGRRLQLRAALLAVANTATYGGGVPIAPDADAGDGLLDVVVIDAVSPLAAARIMPLVLAGRHLQHPAVHVHRARTVELLTAAVPAGRSPRPHADGEPAGALPLTCQVVPGALRILC